jgi:DNA-binding transcriptional regulator GbsR (MarR family)
MKLEDARLEFVQTWGTLGSAWGIPRSMAQIHALLLSHKEPLSTEDVMDTIQLSRGNVSINLRDLVNWKLISKQIKLGERKEFFIANHVVWSMVKHIAQERKKREIQPVLDFLATLKTEKLEGKKEDIAHFRKMVEDLHDLVLRIDELSDLALKLNENVFFQKMLKTMVS